MVENNSKVVNDISGCTDNLRRERENSFSFGTDSLRRHNIIRDQVPFIRQREREREKFSLSWGLLGFYSVVQRSMDPLSDYFKSIQHNSFPTYVSQGIKGPKVEDIKEVRFACIGVLGCGHLTKFLQFFRSSIRLH